MACYLKKTTRKNFRHINGSVHKAIEYTKVGVNSVALVSRFRSPNIKGYMPSSARYKRFILHKINHGSIDYDEEDQPTRYPEDLTPECTNQVLGIPYSDDMLAHLVARFTLNVPELTHRLNSPTIHDSSNDVDSLIFYIAGITGSTVPLIIEESKTRPLISILKQNIIEFKKLTECSPGSKKTIFLQKYVSVSNFGGGELMSRLYDMVEGDEGLFSLTIELIVAHSISTSLTLPGFEGNWKVQPHLLNVKDAPLVADEEVAVGSFKKDVLESKDVEPELRSRTETDSIKYKLKEDEQDHSLKVLDYANLFDQILADLEKDIATIKLLEDDDAKRELPATETSTPEISTSARDTTRPISIGKSEIETIEPETCEIGKSESVLDSSITPYARLIIPQLKFTPWGRTVMQNLAQVESTKLTVLEICASWETSEEFIIQLTNFFVQEIGGKRNLIEGDNKESTVGTWALKSAIGLKERRSIAAQHSLGGAFFDNVCKFLMWSRRIAATPETIVTRTYNAIQLHVMDMCKMRDKIPSSALIENDLLNFFNADASLLVLAYKYAFENETSAVAAGIAVEGKVAKQKEEAGGQKLAQEKITKQKEEIKAQKLAQENSKEEFAVKKRADLDKRKLDRAIKKAERAEIRKSLNAAKVAEKAERRDESESRISSALPSPDDLTNDRPIDDNADTFYLLNDDDYTKYVYDEFDEDEDFQALSDQIADLFPSYSRTDLKVRLKVTEDISELIEELFLEQETNDILQKVSQENRDLDYEESRRHFGPDVYQLKEIFPTHDLDVLERLLGQYNGDLEMVTDALLSGTISATYERVESKAQTLLIPDTELWGTLQQAAVKLASLCDISTNEAIGFLEANNGKFVETLIQVVLSLAHRTVAAAPVPEVKQAIPRGGRVQRGGANIRVVKRKVAMTTTSPRTYKYSLSSNESREMFNMYASNPALGTVDRKFLEKALEFYSGDPIRVIDICRLIVEHDCGYLTTRDGKNNSKKLSGVDGVSYATAASNAASRSLAFTSSSMAPQFAKLRSKIIASLPVGRDLKSSSFQEYKRSGDLDLHHLKLVSAILVTKLALKDWWQRELSEREYEGKLSKYGARAEFVSSLVLITGRGLHSAGGIPVIKRAVGNYLKTNGFLYDEGVGSFVVTGYRGR